MSSSWNNLSYHKRFFILARIQDFKQYVKDRLGTSNNNFISEAGHKENWKGKIDEKRVNNHLSEVIDYLESLKE